MSKCLDTMFYCFINHNNDSRSLWTKTYIDAWLVWVEVWLSSVLSYCQSYFSQFSSIYGRNLLVSKGHGKKSIQIRYFVFQKSIFSTFVRRIYLQDLYYKHIYGIKINIGVPSCLLFTFVFCNFTLAPRYCKQEKSRFYF